MKLTGRELIAKVDGYQLGVQHGKTMAEVDVYYQGLLKEIKELQEIADSHSASSSWPRGSSAHSSLTT